MFKSFIKAFTQDPQSVILIGDQPTCCPKCGCRTHFTQVSANRQAHECTNFNCKHKFYAEEDTSPENFTCWECGASTEEKPADGRCLLCIDS